MLSLLKHVPPSLVGVNPSSVRLHLDTLRSQLVSPRADSLLWWEYQEAWNPVRANLVVREIWFIISTTSASIRWIWPSYTYPNESNRVVVYWMESHNMFGCYMDMRWWKYIWLYDEYVLALAYPFCCMVVLYVVVLPCDDHQLGWWE